MLIFSAKLQLLELAIDQCFATDRLSLQLPLQVFVLGASRMDRRPVDRSDRPVRFLHPSDRPVERCQESELTRKTAFCEVFHFRMKCSVFSSRSTCTMH